MSSVVPDDEFLAEATELVESISRDVLVLDGSQRANAAAPPSLINALFRNVHTLKGLAGMFGVLSVAEVAHRLEELLHGLRLGRVDLTEDLIDVLFSGVDQVQRHLLGQAPHSGDDPLGDAVSAIGQDDPRAALLEAGLEENVLAVLTEYEEHRLRTNFEEKVPLIWISVSYPLTSIDSDLERLRGLANTQGEVITFLPSMDSDDPDAVSLRVLVATRVPHDELAVALGLESTDVTLALQERVPLSKEPSEAPEGAPVDALAVKPLPNSVRVDIRKLDRLMTLIGELGLVRTAVASVSGEIGGHPSLRALTRELHRISRQFDRNLGELQEGIIAVRMVPLSHLFDRFGRMVRQVAREFGNEVSLEVTGGDTELDKLIVEDLSDPLMHIIRNAIGHGIEKPRRRLAAGKAERGTIAINAFAKGNRVVIEVEDDGAGIDTEKLGRVASERSDVPEATLRDMSREELLGLIFLPGVSTSGEVNNVTGRGVGMDVVKTNVARLGGGISVESEMGVGTKFTLTLPITLAIVRALIVEVGDHVFAFPLTAVREAIAFDPSKVRRVEAREVMSLRDETLPIGYLDELFEFGSQGARRFVVVCVLGTRQLGFVVDELRGQQDVVIKPLGASLAQVKGFSGATDVGDQRVALVLDPSALFEEVLGGFDTAAARVVELAAS